MLKMFCDVCECELTAQNTVSGHWLPEGVSSLKFNFKLGNVRMAIVQTGPAVDLDACVSCLFKAIPQADPRNNLEGVS